VFTKFRKATVSFALSVRPSVTPFAWNNLSPTRRIFMMFYIGAFFENLSRRFRFRKTLTRTVGNLHENLRAFMAVLAEIFLE